MVLWKFTYREIKNRPGRATLTLLSIIIGVTAVVAVTISTNTTHNAYRDMYESISGKAAFEVVADRDGFFNIAVAKRLEQCAEVKSVVPTVQKLTKLFFNKKRILTMVMGVDPLQDEAVRDYELSKGGFFRDGKDALMESGFAKAFSINVGDQIKLITGSGAVESFKVCGLLAPKGTSNFNQSGLVFLPLQTAEECWGRPNSVNNVSIILNENVDEKIAKERLAALLPSSLQLRTPAVRMQLSKDSLKSAEQGLAFIFALNIVLAIFMIFNTFLMNVGERRRQLSILRAIGTTRKQIMRMLLLEGFAMGLLGTILGSLAGVGGAYLLTAGMMKVYSNSMPALVITPEPFIIALLLGPAISLIGAFVPAYMAGKITPLEGMRPIISENNRRIPVSFMVIGVLVFIITGSLLAASIAGYMPLSTLPLFGVIFTAAFVMLVPIVLKHLSRFTAAVLYPLFRVEGQLAGRQILRRRARTTLTIGILYVAVSTAVSLGITIVNHINDVRSWYDKTMMGDFFVRATVSEAVAGVGGMQINESFGKKIQKIDGVDNLDGMRFVSTKVEGSQSVVVIRDFSDKNNLKLVLKEGQPAAVRRKLAQGEAVIGTVMANRLGKKIGDEISVETSEGIKTTRVAGTATVYLFGGMVLYMEGEKAKHMMCVDGVDTFVVSADPNKVDSVEAKLKKLCVDQGLILHSFSDLRHRLDWKLNGVIGSLWGVMALGFIVGAFGMANTLTMNVLEQTRELALLRVVAMTRRQVRKTILAQAAIIGFIGLFTGTIGGVIGSYIINLSSIPLFGYSVDLVIHPSLIAICFVTGLVVILLTAWIPAERAARLNLLIALQYE
ncbi:MAG: FtsX-like permease family protein [Thermoguttaceae bacterium]